MKLGTLYEYREIEHAHLVDPDEGKFSFKIQFDGDVKLSHYWFNTIFNNSVRFGKSERYRIPGRFSLDGSYFNYIATDDEFVTLRNSRALITREALNGFIFCMSLVGKIRHSTDIFPQYDDCWFTTFMRAEMIGDELTELLLNEILRRRILGDHIIPPDVPTEGLTVTHERGLVEYLDREIHISSDADMSVSEFIKKTDSLHFIKPPSFITEKEYRYSFKIVSEGKIIEPIVKSVLLTSENISAWAY